MLSQIFREWRVKCRRLVSTMASHSSVRRRFGISDMEVLSVTYFLLYPHCRTPEYLGQYLLTILDKQVLHFFLSLQFFLLCCLTFLSIIITQI